MTWKTSIGNRVLEDHEQYLFLACLSWILDNYMNEKFDNKNAKLDRLLGNNAFERLTDNQKIALFWKVAYYLLEDTGDDIPTLTNLNESAIFYVYQHLIQNDLESELETIEFSEDHDTKLDLVLKCIQLHCRSEDEDEDESDPYFPTSRDDKNESRWRNAIETLADRILWDRDFEEDFEGLFAPLTGNLMIESDYHVKYKEDPRFPSKTALAGCHAYYIAKSEELRARIFAKPQPIPPVVKEEDVKKTMSKKESNKKTNGPSNSAAVKEEPKAKRSSKEEGAKRKINPIRDEVGDDIGCDAVRRYTRSTAKDSNSKGQTKSDSNERSEEDAAQVPPKKKSKKEKK